MRLGSLREIMRPGIHNWPQHPRLTCMIRGCSGMGERRKDDIDTIAMNPTAVTTSPPAVRSEPIKTADTVVARLEV